MVSAKRVYGLTTPFVSVFPDPITKTAAPTADDKNYPNGFVWIYKNGDTRTSYFYGGLDSSGDAVWILAGPGASEVDTLTGDTGGPLSPTAGNINILGGDGMTVAGSGSTLTINRDAAGGYPVTPYVVGPIGEAGYQTIQAALDAIGAGNSGQIWVQPGTYTEDLVFPSAINVGIITGSDEDAGAAEIVGIHTPPSTGNVVLWRMKMTSSTHIFSSNVAGSAALVCAHNNYDTDGYIFNLPNWTSSGTLTTFAIGDFLSTSDGIVNNTGGASVFLFQSGLGVGTSNPCIMSGFTAIQLMDISCPMTIQGSATCEIEYSTFFEDLTLAGSSSGYMTSCRIASGADAAITYSTSGNFEVSNVSLNSSNVPCIAGSGSGTISLNGVSFEDDDSLSASLTVAGGTTSSGTFNTLDQANGLTITSNGIDADGSSTNIDITLTAKGTGNVVIDNGGLEAGTGDDLSLLAATGQDVIMVLGDNAGANKLSVEDSDNVEVFAVDSNGGLTFSSLTVTGAFTQTAGVVSISEDNSANAVGIANGTTARAVTLASSAAAHTVTIGSVTGAASLDLRAGTGNFTLEGGTATTYDISATGANTGTVTIAAGTGARIVNLATGGTGVKTVNLATGAIGNIVTIGTVTAAASLDLLCGTGNFTLEGNVASTYDISATGVNTGTVTIAAGTGARTVNLGTGGTGVKTINVGTGAIGNIITMGTVTAAASLDLLCGTGNFTLEGNVASTYEISSTGINTGTCKFASGTGARTVEIAGGGTGIKTVNIGAAATADVITIGTTTGAGSTTIAAGSGDITLSGTVKEVNSEFAFSSGTDLTVTQSPVLQTAATTGGVPTGATGDVNLMSLQDGCLMEQFILGAGQTIIAPRMTANGLDLALDQTSTEGAEYNFGARNNAKHAYTIGTSAAFFMEATFYVTDYSGCAPLMMGFRKVEANNAVLADYTDYALIGINSATSGVNATILSELNSGGQTATDTTDALAAEPNSFVVKVLVSAAGVTTFEVDGSAASAAPSFTFDNTDVVMPCIHFLNGADLAGEVGLQTLKIGFQA